MAAPTVFASFQRAPDRLVSHRGLTVLQQQTETLQAEQLQVGEKVAKQLNSVKHLLWHGNSEKALEGLAAVITGLDLFRPSLLRQANSLRVWASSKPTSETISMSSPTAANGIDRVKRSARRSRNPRSTKWSVSASSRSSRCNGRRPPRTCSYRPAQRL